MKTPPLALLAISLFFTLVLMSARISEALFQRVVPMAAFSLSELKTYSKQHFQNEDFTSVEDATLTANPDSTTFQFPQQFMLYNRSMLKHPIGLITYRATVELKEEKLRYSADSVYFQSYSRNRYSRYVPDNIPPVPLERWQQTWQDKESERYTAQIETTLETHLQELIDAIQQQKANQINATNLEAW
jgi:hypothetical protein